MNMGEKLARARRSCNLTQEQLAEKLGVTRQSVSRWESGTAFPETDKLVRLAELLQINCDYLLRDDVEEDGQQRRAGTATRLLEAAVGRRAMITTSDEDGASCQGIIREFDGSWAKVEVLRGKKSEIRLIPISSILSLSFLPEQNRGGE